jgi:Fungal protein kinase
MVLSFSHATEEDLGYDWTFRLVGNAAQYEIDVGERTFLTSGVLSDIAADRMCGRATRVFKVYEKSNSTKMLALKDQWIDDDREGEAATLHSLHSQIKEAHKKKTFEDMNLLKNPWEYFLTVYTYGRVKVGGRDDNTKETIMRGLSLSEDHSSMSLVIDKTTVGPAAVTESTGHIPYPNAAVALVLPERVPHLAPRRHERIVFNELGEALHDLDSLADLFRGLADATLGKLRYLTCCCTDACIFVCSSRNYPPNWVCPPRYKHWQYPILSGWGVAIRFGVFKKDFFSGNP